MRTVNLILAAIGLPLTLNCRSSLNTGAASERDSVAIRHVLDQRRRAIETADPDGWLATFSENARFIRPFGGEDLVGKQALRSWASPFFRDLKMEYTETVEELTVSGGWAFGRINADFRTVPRGGGSASADRETGLVLFREDSTGAWRISHVMLTSLPPDAKGLK